MKNPRLRSRRRSSRLYRKTPRHTQRISRTYQRREGTQTGPNFENVPTDERKREIEEIKDQIECLTIAQNIKLVVYGILAGLNEPEQEIDENELLKKARAIASEQSNDLREQKFQEQMRKRFEDLLNLSSDVHFVIHSETGYILFVNEKIKSLFNYQPETLHFKKLEEIMPKELCEQIKKGEISEDGDKKICIKKADGSLHPVTIKSINIPWQHGEVMLVTIHDIQKENKIQELEKKVKDLEIKAKLGDFSARLAHEVNNILTSIDGCIDILNRFKEEKRDMQSMSTSIPEIKEMIRRGRVLAQDVLECTRGQKLRRRKSSITGIVRSLVNTYEKQKNIEFTTHIKKEYYANIDPVKFASAIENLLINACDAIKYEGRIDVEVDTVTFNDFNRPGEDFPADKKYICITIKDNGEGIPPDIIKEIFTPYFTTKEKGTGLGLAITNQIIVLHGGKILVESKPGYGTRFKIYLPLNSQQEKISTLGDKRGRQFRTTELMRGRRLVVFDDRDLLRKLNERYARKLKLECDIVTTADECISLIENELNISAVLLDQNLDSQGKIKGTEIAKKIKEIRPDILIILYSGVYSDDEIESGLHNGSIDRFLRKPYDFEDLKFMLKEIFADAMP